MRTGKLINKVSAFDRGIVSINENTDEAITLKTINGEAILGAGNIEIQGGGSYTAGHNISIENDVISSLDEIAISDTEPTEESVTLWVKETSTDLEIPSMSDLETLSTEIETKQDKLIAGENITIVNNVISSTGGGEPGTTDYNELMNKPSINSVELSGNKTSSDLGLQSSISKVTYTASQVAAGVELVDSSEISISDALETFNVTSCDGIGLISFVAGTNTLFELPSGQGWDSGISPAFVSGKRYQVVYSYGTWYGNNGR